MNNKREEMENELESKAFDEVMSKVKTEDPDKTKEFVLKAIKAMLAELALEDLTRRYNEYKANPSKAITIVSDEECKQILANHDSNTKKSAKLLLNKKKSEKGSRLGKAHNPVKKYSNLASLISQMKY